MTLSIVVAASDDDVIGIHNSLPWHIPEDLKQFRRTTYQHVVVAGRRTHESILERLGHPLPDRYTVVLSRTSVAVNGGSCVVARTFDEAINIADELRSRKAQDEAFVIGGSSLYRQSLPRVGKIYLTRVHQCVKGDSHLLPGWLDDFSLDTQSETMTSRSGIPYTFLSYVRN